MLKHDPTSAEINTFMREAALMAPLNHPNVVGLVGVVTAGEPRLIALQFCEHGSLLSFLRSRTGFNALQLQSKYNIILDVAEGMVYLSKRKIVHRDLAARNVLVNADYLCKVADFGLSREVGTEESDYYAVSTTVMPLRWTAPEALKTRHFSSASDVWAFGVTCGEVFDDGAQPYPTFNNTEVMVHVQAGNGLPCPALCPPAFFAEVLGPCFAEKPEARPRFRGLARAVRPYLDAAVLNNRRAAFAHAGHGAVDRSSSRMDSMGTTFTAGSTSLSGSHGDSAMTSGTTNTTYIRPDDDPEEDQHENMHTHTTFSDSSASEVPPTMPSRESAAAAPETHSAVGSDVAFETHGAGSDLTTAESTV
jgi:serine/threonine protein kinase